MGRETISSKEFVNFQHVLLDADLAAICRVFEKIGKRGVGYNVGVAGRVDPQDPAYIRPAQHRAVRGRAPGSAIASSDIFADHGFASWRSSIATAQGGREIGAVNRASQRRASRRSSEEQGIVVWAYPCHAMPRRASPTTRGGGRQGHLQLLRSAADRAPEVTVHTSNSGVHLLDA